MLYTIIYNIYYIVIFYINFVFIIPGEPHMSDILTMALELSGSGLHSSLSCRRRRLISDSLNFTSHFFEAFVSSLCRRRRSGTNHHQRFTRNTCISRKECSIYTTPHSKYCTNISYSIWPQTEALPPLEPPTSCK